jgi:alkyl hydroperoxide reductase subunit AhpC
MGATLVTVSTDTEFVHLAWKRDEKELADVKYLMGADPTGKVSRLFGVYDEGSGLALRGTFIISPDGTLFNSRSTSTTWAATSTSSCASSRPTSTS